MWSKVEAENKIFDMLEFIETVIAEYFKTIYRILVHPKKTLEYLRENEVVTPLIFFLLNLLITGILESFGNLSDFVSKILKSLVLTTKPSFDEAFLSILGLLTGTLIYLFLLRLTCSRVIKQKFPYASIAKPILYASFLFIPIAILKDIISSVFMGKALWLLGRNSGLIVLFLTNVVPSALALWWWSYIIYLGLKVQMQANLKFGRCIFFALLIFVSITEVASNIRNLEKLSGLRYLREYQSTTEKALAKQPPDYLTAAMATAWISQSKILVPYRRYCECIRSITYISMLIRGFDSSYAIKTLRDNKYGEVESYFANAYDEVNASPHTDAEYRHLKFLKDTLNNAVKVRKEENYIHGEYETSFGLQISFSNSDEGIRIVP